MRAPPRFKSADTSRLFATARIATVPFACGSRRNFSQVPAVARFAIKRLVLGAARPVSAATKLPLIVARKETVPSELLMTSKFSHVLAVAAVAVK